MAVKLKNAYVTHSQEHAQHINERHVDVDKEHGASEFLRFFNLTTTLALLVRKTFLDTHDYEIIEEGYKAGHGYYFINVFKMKKVIGVCPWGYPTDMICVHFSWKEAYGDKFKIITAYPFSSAYHFFFKQTKSKMMPFCE